MKKLLTYTLAFGVALSAAMAADDIVDTAKSTGKFKTLTAALEAAGKTEMLERKRPVHRVRAQRRGVRQAAEGHGGKPAEAGKQRKLVDILAYHVLKGKVVAADVKTMMAKTANGAELDIKVKDGKVMVNDAHVVKADVKASNGVIHVIDKVLMPPTK